MKDNRPFLIERSWTNQTRRAKQLVLFILASMAMWTLVMYILYTDKADTPVQIEIEAGANEIQTESRYDQETDVPETNNYQETDVPGANNHQVIGVPGANDHQETDVLGANNHQETDVSPPKKTQKPNSLNNEADDTKTSDNNQVNKEYCGGPECRFLFVFALREQESRGQIWFRIFVEVAHTLNRIMVLPNVGDSRLSSCRPYPFDYYYDVEGLAKLYPKVRFISQADFEAWANKRSTAPTVRHFYLSISNKDTTNRVLHYNRDISYVKKLSCMDNVNLQLERTPFNSTEFRLSMTYAKTLGSTERAQKLFIETANRTNPEVLMMDHQIVQFNIYHYSRVPVPYSKHIRDRATAITARMRPYVAIHWRMEGGPVENMPRCAVALVAHLNRLRDEHGLVNVYLATDYPVNGAKRAQSDTFHELGEPHHQAMRILNSSVTLNTWYTQNGHAERGHERGGGLIGILDKWVVTYSNYFMQGPPPCRKPRSTWAIMVSNMRRQLRKSGKRQQILNEMDEWEYSG